VAGIFASLRITGKKKVHDNVFLFQGAGEVSPTKLDLNPYP
jgi:hypothetical protein